MHLQHHYSSFVFKHQLSCVCACMSLMKSSNCNQGYLDFYKFGSSFLITDASRQYRARPFAIADNGNLLSYFRQISFATYRKKTNQRIDCGRCIANSPCGDRPISRVDRVQRQMLNTTLPLVYKYRVWIILLGLFL